MRRSAQSDRSEGLLSHCRSPWWPKARSTTDSERPRSWRCWYLHGMSTATSCRRRAGPRLPSCGGGGSPWGAVSGLRQGGGRCGQVTRCRSWCMGPRSWSRSSAAHVAERTCDERRAGGHLGSWRWPRVGPVRPPRCTWPTRALTSSRSSRRAATSPGAGTPARSCGGPAGRSSPSTVGSARSPSISLRPRRGRSPRTLARRADVVVVNLDP